MTDEVKLYAVSYGNGNDGVSHMYPDFFVRTDDPWNLARLAIITNLNESYQDWGADNVDVDGEAEYTISAVLYDPPGDETETDEYDDGGSWSDANGAWMIAEVFPIEESELPDQSDPYGKKPYADLVECFGADVVAKYAEV